MKKSGWAVLIVIGLIIGGAFWLLRGANPDNIQRQYVVVDVADTFEK